MFRKASTCAAALLAMLAWAAVSLFAHDLERTKVALTFAADGTFVLEVANDPEWLLLRLEPFAAMDFPGLAGRAPRAGGSLPADVRDQRLGELAPVFADRIVILVDGYEARASRVEYVPPRNRETGDGSRESMPTVGAPADGTISPTLAVYRLRGRVDPNARALRWFYGIVADPYPLVVTRVNGAVSTEWIGGAVWSGTTDLTGQFVKPTTWSVVKQYLALGYTHILPKGLDHILFVIGIFLLSPRLKTMLLQVTAFTLAHSITLGLTMYGIVSLSPRVVEPLIALSIAYVAVENLVTSELKPWRLALVFSFGLLHGMGFAGVLRDLGLPRDQFLTALLTFNLGVEGGQLTVIAAAAMCVWWLTRRDWY
jgi:hypothetical protein